MKGRVFGEQVLRLALRCHPPEFRREYGEELVEYYRDALHGAPSRHRLAWRLRFLVTAVLAAVGEGFRQRRSSRLATDPLQPATGRSLDTRRGGGPLFSGFTTDVKQALRRMVARPFAAALAAGMLALAIGVTTAMFTVVDALLLRPVPFPDPDRLAHVALRTDRTIMGNVPRPVFHAWRNGGLFAAVEGSYARTSLVDVSNDVVSAEAAFVTPGLLPMLGATPIAGRLFASDEGRVGRDDAVLISERMWRQLFGGDSSIVGMPLRVEGRSLVIVGVLPDSFRFPAWDTQFWRPFDFATQPERSTSERPAAFVRFDTTEGIRATLERATTLAHAVDPETSKLRADVREMAGLHAGQYLMRATPYLAGGVALVFLVLCANVASLLLAQMSGRAREFSLCSALGASRARLIRQALTESIVLGCAGTAVGIAAAWALVGMMRAWLPDAFLMETLNPVDLDPRALVAASLSGLAATSGAGLLPAWIGTRVHPAGAGAEVSAASRSATDSRVARVFTRGLLVVEVALTCALLVGTSLLVASFVRLADVERGLDTRGVMTAWVRLTAPASKAPAGVDAVKDAVAGMPGVETVSISQSAPPRGGMIHFGCCWFADTPGAQPLDLVVDGYMVDNDAFTLYRIPIVRGRTFRPNEPETSVILGERLAETLFPDGNAVGRSFRRDDERFDVVGVARELRYPSLDRMRDVPEYYRPSGPLGSQVNVNIRCQGPCPSVAALRQRLQALPEVREIYQAGLMDEAYAAELSRPRAAATMAVLFTGIAVIAACGGLFSVLSYAVGRRRREFGIRVSLGAAPSQVQRLVFREGLRLAIAGAVLGSLVAWVISRALASVVYEVSPTEPVIWVSVAIIVAVTTLAASWVPARRASRIDPAVLLRE